MAKRRFRALLIASIYLVGTFYPMSKAFAIFPLPVLVPAAMGAAGAAVDAAAGAAAGAGLADLFGTVVGAGLAGLIVLTPSNAGQPPTKDDEGVRIPSTATTPVPIPVNPNIPSVVPTITRYSLGVLSSGSVADLCSQRLVSLQKADTGMTMSVLSAAGAGDYGCLFSSPNTRAFAEYPAAAYECPQGYSGSSGSCSMTDPRGAIPDQKRDIQRSGPTYSPYPTDKDAPGKITPIYSTRANPNDTVTMSGVDGSGGAFSISAQAMSNGGTVITAQAQKTDASGQTYVQTKMITVDATGTVTGVQSGSQGGSMTYNSTTQKYDVTTNNVTLNIPASASGSGTAAGTGTGSTTVVNTTTQAPAITFPSDYAKQGEAASAAQTVKTAVDSLTQKTPPPAIPTSKNSSDFSNNFETPLTQTFQGLGLSGWRVPAHASTCPVYPIKVSFAGKEWINTTLNVHCQLFDTFSGVFSNFMVVAYVLIAFFILMGA
jgi:hypothetical protein